MFPLLRGFLRLSHAILLVLGVGSNALGDDRGFRYVNDRCTGYNPGYIGQCGDLRNTRLVGKDLSGKDLSGSLLNRADLRLTDLRNTKLIGADLSQALIVDAKLEKTDFTRAMLKEVEFYGDRDTNFNMQVDGIIFDKARLDRVLMRGVEFNDLQAQGAFLHHAQLQSVTFNDANLMGSQFKFARLNIVRFKNSNLSNSDLTDIKIVDWKLDNTTLKNVTAIGANFSGQNFSNMDLSRSNFSRAKFIGATLTETDFTGSNLEQVDFSSAVVDAVKFNKADLSKVIGDGTDFSYSEFKEARLINAKMNSAKLIETDFTEATLTGSQFKQAQANDAIFVKSTLNQTDLSRANLAKSDFKLAIGRETIFDRAVLRDAHFESARLIRGNFERTRMEKADLRDGFFRQSSFASANLTDVKLDRADLKLALYNRRSILPFKVEEAIERGMTEGSLRGHDLGIFYNPNIIQTSVSPNSEGYTLLQYFVTNKYEHRLITNTEATAIAKDLSALDILVIPEQGERNLAAFTDDAAKKAYQNFVQDGGTLIVIGSNYTSSEVKFVNKVFGWDIEITNRQLKSKKIDSATRGTLLADGPSGLEEQNSGGVQMQLIAKNRLPAGARVLYEADGDLAAVFMVQYGGGEIYYLAYDWNNAKPAYALDGGWLRVLGLVTQVLQ